MIRVVYFMPFLNVGGMQRYLLNLATFLDKSRYQVTVWTYGEWGPLGDALLAAGAEVIQQRIMPYRPSSIIRGVERLKAGRFDIAQSLIQCPNQTDAFVVRMAGIPVFVGSRRDLRTWEHGDQMHAGEVVNNLLADVIIANSGKVADLTVEFEHVPRRKVIVIHNGVDFAEARRFGTAEARERVRGMLGAGDRTVLIGHVATFQPVKGQRHLIDAFAMLRRSTEADVRLAIIGTGQLRERLLAQVRELGLGDRVVITELSVNRFEAAAAFDIFALPSLGEGCSHSLLESMALGKPAVATAVGGNLDQVAEGETGLLVPSGDAERMALALQRLVDEPELRAMMGEAARRRAERHFDLREKTGEHQRVYERLLQKKRAG